MHKKDARLMVYCRNAGSLIGHAIRLNMLGYYRLSLCGSAEEVVELLELGARFRFLIFDGFDLDADAQSLKEFAWFDAVDDFIVVSDVNSEQCLGVIRWGREFDVPLRAVLQAPLRDHELAQAVGCDNTLGGSRSPCRIRPSSRLCPAFDDLV